jgi:surface protein
MEYMFGNCINLTYLYLPDVKIYDIENMEGLFFNCSKLEYLDLSNFGITSVTTISYMFYLCKSLLYLNLYSFIYKSGLSKSALFDSVPSDSKFCIKDPTTISKLLDKTRKSNCCDICFSDNPQIDLKKRQCTQTGENYENKFCDLKNTIKIISYEEEDEIESENEVEEENEDDIGDIENEEDEKKCKYFSDNINKCFENLKEGYYFDPDDGYYKKCYESCKKCNTSGDEINNNCLECISNLTFLNDSFHIMNCYENCQYYYYFNYLDE